MDYQKLFRKDFIKTSLKVALASWFKVSIAYFFLHIIIVGISILISAWSIFGLSETDLKIDSIFTVLNLDALNVDKYISNDGLIMLVVIYIVSGIIMISWYTNFSLTAIKLKKDDIPAGFGKVFMASFNSGIFKILLVILIYLIFNGLILFGGFYVVRISPWLIIPGSMIYLFMIFKSILFAPAYVLGKMSFVKSFRFSFSKITLYRIIKTLYFSIILLAILFISLSLFLFLPEIGFAETWITYVVLIIKAIVQAVVFGFLSLLFITVISGLFYRYYAPEETKKDERVYNIIDYKLDDGISEPYDITKNLFSD